MKTKLIAEGYMPNKLAIKGWSAGGHLALLYGYSRYQQSSIPIEFLVADVAPTDFLDTECFRLHGKHADGLLSALSGQKIRFQDVLNQSSVLRDMSPLYSVVSGVPPTLMRYGAQDKIIPVSQGTNLKAALDLAGVRNDLFIYPNSDHDLYNSSDADISNSYKAVLQEYLNTYFHN